MAGAFERIPDQRELAAPVGEHTAQGAGRRAQARHHRYRPTTAGNPSTGGCNLPGVKASAWGRLVVLCGSAMMAGAGCGRSPLGSTGSHSPAGDANVVGDAYAPTAPEPDAYAAKDAMVNCTQARRSAAPCPSSQWYAFQGDSRCFLCASSVEPGCSSHVTYTCTSWGDGLCYLLCQSDADCTDPCFPFCRDLMLYGGNEHCGASSRSVCLRADRGC